MPAGERQRSGMEQRLALAAGLLLERVGPERPGARRPTARAAACSRASAMNSRSSSAITGVTGPLTSFAQLDDVAEAREVLAQRQPQPLVVETQRLEPRRAPPRRASRAGCGR